MGKGVTLRDQLANTEAEVEAIKRKIAAEQSCSVRGHVWVFVGGKNAGCSDVCGCSVPVHTCRDCGDCDYGDTEEAGDIMSQCESRKALEAPND